MGEGNVLQVFLSPIGMGALSIVFVIVLTVNYFRRRRKESETPWISNAPAKTEASSIEDADLESRRQTLGLKPRADEEKEREQARRVLTKSRWRRLFGK